MPCRLSGEIGPLSCRGLLHLRGWVGARPEACRTSLPFFSILNDSNKHIAGNRLWVALLGLKTRNHASCQLQFHRTLLVVSFVCLQSDVRFFFIPLLHWVTLPFLQGHQKVIPLLGLSLGSDFGKPKGPLHLWVCVSQFKIERLPEPVRNLCFSNGS